jgi:hypothetical protein
VLVDVGVAVSAVAGSGVRVAVALSGGSSVGVLVDDGVTVAGSPVADTEGVGVGSAVLVGLAVGIAVGSSVTSGGLLGRTGKKGRYKA